MTKIASSFLDNCFDWSKSVRLFLALMAFACFVTLSPSRLFAQNVQHTENRPDLGLRSEARVDPSTLGMSFSIPLASYPGRAGHELPVAITYSSKVLRVAFRHVDSPPISGAITWTGVEFAEHSTAGWTSTLTPPRVEFTGMGQYYDLQGRSACPDVCVPGQTNPGDRYIKRIHVHMPDGSSHEMRLDDQVYLVPAPVNAFTGTFHAVDGSRMRFESNAGTASILYLPDGSRYLFGPYNGGTELTATHFIDRNGNTLAHNAGTRQWTDTLGRVITNPLPADPAPNTETYFSAKLVGGADATYTLRWKYLADVLTPDPSTGLPPPLRYPGNYKCAPNSYQNVSPSLITSGFDTRVCVEQDQAGNPLLFNPVVLAEVVLPTGKFYRFTYNVYGEIDKILLTTGATDRFSYGQVPTLSSSTAPYNQINRGVSERRLSATGAAADESVWTYAVPSTHPNYIVRTTRPDSSYSERLLHKSRYTQSGGPVMQFDFDDARMGMVYEERNFSSSGIMLRRSLSKWVEAGPTAGGYPTAERDPKVTKQVAILLDAAGSNALTATTVNRYEQANQPLNLTSLTEYGFDNSMSKTMAQTEPVDWFNPGGSLAVRTTETAYLDDAAYFARGLVSLPTSVTVRSGMPGGTQRARIEISYDQTDTNHTLLTCGATVGWGDPGSTARGNATTTANWLNTTGVFLQTHTQYDHCGNVRKTWDARDTTLSNPAQVEYSSQYHFAYATLRTSPDPDKTGPLTSHTTSTEYDFSTGLVTATIDTNTQRTTFAYNDPLNRPKEVIRAATDDSVKNRTTYEYDDNARTVTVRADLYAFNDQVLKTETLYDGLGRAAESRQYEGGDNFIIVKTEYDSMGRPFKTSNPFRPWQSQTADWTTQLFDDLSRVTSVKTPDNAVVSTSYSGNSVTVTDQAGKKRKSVTDALGRLVEVYEDPNGVNWQTTYLYDELDNLLRVTQGSQQRFFMYDSLKRLIRARNPEQATRASLDLSEPITGNNSWSIGYEYDSNSNLIKKTDARGVESIYVYDQLNRNTTINYTDTPINTDVEWFYDGATNGKGRFWKVSKGGDLATEPEVDHTAIDSYDALGRPRVKRQVFKTAGNPNPTTYQIERTYNLADGVTSQKYPSQRLVTYNYDVAGRLADDGQNLAFTGNLGDGVQRTYATEISYSQWGSLSREKFGTNTPLYHKTFYNIRGQFFDTRLSSVSDMWDWNRGRLILYYSSNHVWGQSGTDNNGNVHFAETWIPPENATLDQADVLMEDSYSYDALNRLSNVMEQRMTAAGGWVWQQQFRQAYSYDRYGNRTIDGTLTWGTGINNKQFTVDTPANRLYAPGDLALQENQRQMRYDFAGNLTNDTYTGAGLREYDAENRMTRAWGGSNQSQYYTYNADGQRTRRKVDGQETWQIYGFDGELLAEYAAQGPNTSPQKEYGYRNGQLLITAAAGTASTNVALASNGATVTASSTLVNPPYSYPVSAVINGDRKGLNAGMGGNWHSATASFPQSVEVVFNGSKTINEIDVFTLQDNYANPVDPTEATTFSLYGVTGFEAQYWNGSAWVTVPGGSVTGNYKVWKKITFPSVTTTKIRVLTNASTDSFSRLVEVEAWAPAVPVTSTNVASTVNGATVSASSTLVNPPYSYPVSAVSNGDRKGLNAGFGGNWHSATATFPQSVEVVFNGSKTINEIDVFTLQDNYANPVEPTEATTFSLYGVTGFEAQYWNGSAWVTVPGGSVTGNFKVWKKITFAPLTTTKIRVLTNASTDGFSRLVEVEAWTSTSANINWLVSDHLATPRMVIDQTGTLANIKRHDYLPFGEELFAGVGGRTPQHGYTGGDGVRQQFTAKERDIETNLDYFRARYYSSVQGRFTSPDLIFADQHETDPQSWNLYTYVGNSPTTSTDPFGLWNKVDCDNGGQCWQAEDENDTFETLAELIGVKPKGLRAFFSGETVTPCKVFDVSGYEGWTRSLDNQFLGAFYRQPIPRFEPGIGGGLRNVTRLGPSLISRIGRWLGYGRSTNARYIGGITAEQAQRLRELLLKIPGVNQVRAFGSRTTGNFVDKSDLDIAAFGDINKFDPNTIRAIREAQRYAESIGIGAGRSHPLDVNTYRSVQEMRSAFRSGDTFDPSRGVPKLVPVE